MSLTLYYHPLASHCWKVRIALYENDTPFTGEIVNLGYKNGHANVCDLWPVGQVPMLRDEERGRTVPETTIIIEYLDRHFPGSQQRLLPENEDLRLDARLWDRFFDLHIHAPMQKIVSDRLRPQRQRDPWAVFEAETTLRMAYDVVERQMSTRTWAIGDAFSIADCAAFPALFYADGVVPFGHAHPETAAYFDRLSQRPSVRRVLEEAKPYFAEHWSQCRQSR
jgi:glutathione S-transferase